MPAKRARMRRAVQAVVPAASAPYAFAELYQHDQRIAQLRRSGVGLECSRFGRRVHCRSQGGCAATKSRAKFLWKVPWIQKTAAKGDLAYWHCCEVAVHQHCVGASQANFQQHAPEGTANLG